MEQNEMILYYNKSNSNKLVYNKLKHFESCHLKEINVSKT